MSARPIGTASARQLALELPLELPAITLAPEWKDQQRLWGHPFHPMCSYLASFPAALTHAFIARYSRPGDVVLDPFSGRGTTPLQACAEGRIGRRQRPEPVRAPADRGQGRAGDPRPGRDAAGALRLGWNASSAGWLALGARVAADPARLDSLVPAAGSARHRADGANPSRPRSRWRSIRARSASSCSSARRSASMTATDRFLAAAVTGILHGKSASYLSELMPNTFSMAPRYVREFAARTAFASPDRDVFDGLSKKLDRLYRQAPPSTQGVALLGDARDVAPRARAALRARGPARSGAAGRHLAALPARRQVRLLQLAADVVPGLRRPRHRRDARRRPPPRAVPPVPARRARRAAAGPRRRRGRRAGHRRRRDRPRPAPSPAGSASPNAPGRRPPSRRAIAWRGWPSTTWPPSAR